MSGVSLSQRSLTLLYRQSEPKAGSRCIIEGRELRLCAARGAGWEESLVRNASAQVPGRSDTGATGSMTRSSTDSLSVPPAAGADAPEKFSTAYRSRVGTSNSSHEGRDSDSSDAWKSQSTLMSSTHICELSARRGRVSSGADVTKEQVGQRPVALAARE